MKRKKIAILFGGNSTEYDVSLASTKTILDHVNKKIYDIITIGITRDGKWYHYKGIYDNISNNSWFNDTANLSPIVVAQNPSVHGFLEFNHDKYKAVKVDLAFPVLHGKNGEDGTVQGLLELAGIPVVGCNVLASALCMNKSQAARLVNSYGIDVAKSITYNYYQKDTITDTVLQQLRFPLFVKPIHSGSSIGITRVTNKNELIIAIDNAFNYDREIIIEEEIIGNELGCAILGIDDLIIGRVDEVEVVNGFYDYNEKYNPQKTNIYTPARINSTEEKKIQQVAATIYKALGCSGLARIDLFYTNDGKIVFNEVNTIPGFTEHSRYPKMMQAIGISFEELLNKLFSLYI